uniref:TPR domain-containing protein n=1 Tax=Castellaniella defragrans TaxID=75697 RepID=UPI0033429105
MNGSTVIWVFAAVTLVLMAAFGVTLYWAGGRGKNDKFRGQSLLLALIVPLAVAGLYALRGEPRALDPAPDMGGMNEMHEMSASVERLANRLKEQPDDYEGWIMLARSYTVMGRYAAAQSAYERAQPHVLQDLGALLGWIEIRLMINGTFDARTNELIGHASALAPEETNVLLLRALSAYSRGDLADADALVARLHERHPPGTQERQDVDAALESWMLLDDVSGKP